jgi:cell division protein FtsB
MSYIAVVGETRHSEKPVRRRHAIKFRMRLGFVTLTAITIALALVLSLMYFLQVSRLTLSGYEITNLESQIRELKDNNKKLSYQISQQKALNVIDGQARERLQMVVAEEVQYWWQSDAEELLARQ